MKIRTAEGGNVSLRTQDLPDGSAGPTVLACGAWLKNAACLLQGGQVHWSPVHGDLGDPANCVALEDSVTALLAQAGTTVAAVAHDLHPDFFSTQVDAIECKTKHRPLQSVFRHQRAD